jgi:monoamine oxidase
MGSVVRIVLELRERIWENGKLLSVSESEALCALSFLHTRDPDIPVWWTAHPIRAPLLVGWAGGPRAARMLRRPPDEIERLAIASLARQLGLTAQKVRGLVQRSWTHNWDQDPFARGAYSYIGVGGVNAPRQLAQAVDGTLFFAGEAADPEGRMGTVNGAIATGVRAAKACLRAYIR